MLRSHNMDLFFSLQESQHADKHFKGLIQETWILQKIKKIFKYPTKPANPPVQLKAQ